MATATASLDTVVNALLNALRVYLPAPIVGLPAPNVTANSVEERSAGIGGRLGTNVVAGFGVIELKGVRLEVVARFQIWGASPADVDTAIAALNMRIMAGRDDLWSAGFLRVVGEGGKPAENVSGTEWRKLSDYRVLYEFPYEDSDDSASLIARIPIEIDSNLNQSMLVTDDMTRWDNLAAPQLVAKGGFSIRSLSALSFIPGPAPNGNVTLSRTFDGATGPPVAHASLATFLGAVAGSSPAERHAEVRFASVAALLAALGPAGSPIVLGDWDLDGISDQYQPKALSLDPPIQLVTAGDRFEITYQNAALDQVAVVYLRLAQSVAS
jgi:hypothetical protein